MSWTEKKLLYEKNLQVHKILKGKIFFCKYARNSLLGGEIMKWKKRKNREKFRSFWKFAKKNLSKRSVFGLRSYTRPSNLHDVTKYEIITITDIPCKCFANYPPRNFPKLWEFPENSNDVETSSRYLSRLEVDEFYRNCEIGTFYLEWFGHGWRPKFKIRRGIPWNSDVEFYSNLRGTYLPYTSKGSLTFEKIDRAVSVIIAF